MDFNEVMKWSAKNKLRFRVVELPDGTFSLEARTDRISSDYPFTGPDDFMSAAWTTAYAVCEGTKFHQQHGYIPKEPPHA